MSQISFFDGSQPLKITKPIRLIELFAGIGSQAKALERLGVDFEHYRLCEFDTYALTSYNAIHGTNFKTSDIRDVNGSDLGIVDTDKYDYILTYSFPCQDLSICGNQKGMEEGSETRSALLWEVKRLLEETEHLPQILVMENVPQVASGENQKHFFEWINFLASLGYNSKWAIMNARDYNVPQNRERCFMVSWVGDYYYEFPSPKPLKTILRNLLQPEEEIDDKYYLSEKGIQYVMRRAGKYTQLLDDQSEIAQSEITAVGNANPILVGGYGEKKSNGGTQWYQQDRVYSADSVAMAHCASLPSGSYDLEVYDMYNAKQIDSNIVGTITSACSHQGSGTFCVRTSKSPIRKLTQKECWRLMDFSDEDYEKARVALNEKFYKGNDRSGSQLYKQAGNSIVVNCLVEIFKQML